MALGILENSESAQVNSRPAAVILVATLESVSVGVALNAPLESHSLGIQDLRVTANWAVPARLTTFQLVVFAPGEALIGSGRVLWQQPAGATNCADSLVKVVRVGEIKQGLPRKDASVASPTTFQIEAL